MISLRFRSSLIYYKAQYPAAIILLLCCVSLPSCFSACIPFTFNRLFVFVFFHEERKFEPLFVHFELHALSSLVSGKYLRTYCKDLLSIGSSFRNSYFFARERIECRNLSFRSYSSYLLFTRYLLHSFYFFLSVFLIFHSCNVLLDAKLNKHGIDRPSSTWTSFPFLFQSFVSFLLVRVDVSFWFH